MNPSNQNKYALVKDGNKDIGFTVYQGLLKAGFEMILAARSPTDFLLIRAENNITDATITTTEAGLVCRFAPSEVPGYDS